ncbi:MAG: glycosyltransferase [Caldilineaceae bacterium]|nr:glycosyltransferase [Caldilineaceae bacterium]
MPARLWDWRRAALLTFLALPLGWRANRMYAALPQLPRKVPDGALPALSIIVPARNEAANLPHLLSSLQQVCYPGPLEVIVVDDHSDDETALIASAYGAHVARVPALPAGWLGKPHACHVGAATARGDWLLFTDADTVHAPDGPRLAVSYALEHDLDGLSLFIGQAYRSVADRIALVAAFAGLFAGRRPQNYVLNGQYILLRRAVYAATDGFAAVRNEAVEDLALGRLLHRRGYRLALLTGDHAATVRMYASLSQAWHGLSRLGSGALRWSGVWSLVTALFVSALMSPLIVLVGVAAGRLHPAWLPWTWLAATASMYPWAQRAGPLGYALLAPIGACIVQAAAIWGIANRLIGRGVKWKGRRV